MESAPATHSHLITSARIERALNRLAQIITEAGAAGVVYLPIYDRLEAELAAAQKLDERLAVINARAAVIRNPDVCKRAS